jgi:hypothetical protein
MRIKCITFADTSNNELCIKLKWIQSRIPRDRVNY